MAGSPSAPPPGYLDAASGEPAHPAARQALLAALDEGWADPARLYREGRRARMLLDQARAAVAGVLGCRPREVIFTSSGTTALHYGIAGILAGRRRVGSRLVLSAVEHSALLHAADVHEATGGSAEFVPVDGVGRVSPDVFAAALQVPGTALAALQSANHEVGTVQPLQSVYESSVEAGVPLLVDACQSVGRIPVPAHWSALCCSAHKWGGPPGVGVLALRKGTRFAPTWPVDEREDGRVPGYVSLPNVVAAAAALVAREDEREAEAVRLAALVERLRTVLPTLAGDVEVFGDPAAGPEHRLPHLVAFSCPAVNAEALVLDLDEAGFAVSSGSACTSDTVTPSHVLVAMGAADRGNVRVSLPFGVREEDVERFLRTLPRVLDRLR